MNEDGSCRHNGPNMDITLVYHMLEGIDLQSIGKFL